MRNMRESYDQISTAAEAYNTGKVQLAAAITSKGVETSPKETYPEMAEKVNAISQETYEINGGEMYAKQLFGSLETPNYWNLYDVLANLLSDGRLVNYGGILLAEYYRGYDSLALSGAGAGGAYVVSDLDENGQFKMYTSDTTHTWDTEFDGHGNRWVAYCFADEYHDFQITDTNTSPRSIFIGRKVGTITSLVNGRVSQIVVPEGNELNIFDSGYFTQQFDKRLVVKNIKNIHLYSIDSESVYLSVSTGSSLNGFIDPRNKQIASVIIENNTPVFRGEFVTLSVNNYFPNLSTLVIFGIDRIELNVYEGIIGGLTKPDNVDVYVTTKELVTISSGSSLYCLVGQLCCSRLFLYGLEYADAYVIAGGVTKPKYLYIGYSGTDKTKGITLKCGSLLPNVTDIELEDGFCKPLNISTVTGSLTEANMYAHILQRLKQDEQDCGVGVTITLGSTNLAKLTSEESVQLLDDLTNIYGYTFA